MKKRKIVSLSLLALVVPLVIGADKCSQEQTNVFTLVNNSRAQYGVPAVSYDGELGQAADTLAEDMAAGRKPFAHPDINGWCTAQYSTCGENIAYNSSIEAAHTAYMNSAGHRANILNPNFKLLGTGYAVGPWPNWAGHTAVYTVHRFGTRW